MIIVNKDLPKLKTFTTHDYSFYIARLLSISSSLCIEVITIDLPQLEVLKIGKKSFFRANTVYMTGMDYY